MYSRTSRNGTYAGEFSNVNLIVVWNVLVCCMNVSSDSLPSDQMKLTSSMNRRHDDRNGCVGALDKRSSSMQAMKRFAYEGAVGVPMAVPSFCR